MICDYCDNELLPEDEMENGGSGTCEKCQAKQARDARQNEIENQLRADGWMLCGASNKSEATYWRRGDDEKRIRVAAHSAVYQSSAECETIRIDQ
jgi:hypothetical protein